MNKVVLEVKSLTIKYNDASVPVISDLSFSINEGEILGLRGRSGKGKSTVVWALTQMLDEYNAQASGEIVLGDKTLKYPIETKDKQKRVFNWRNLALVPQSSMSSFNPVYSIRRTMMETLRTYGESHGREADEKFLSKICEMVRLDPKILDCYPHELSGGMRQRAAIGLAIMFNPRLLILDEATTGLDLLIQAQVLGTILELRQKYNMTILFISHDKTLARSFCDRQIEL